MNGSFNGQSNGHKTAGNGHGNGHKDYPQVTATDTNGQPTDTPPSPVGGGEEGGVAPAQHKE